MRSNMYTDRSLSFPNTEILTEAIDDIWEIYRSVHCAGDSIYVRVVRPESEVVF